MSKLLIIFTLLVGNIFCVTFLILPQYRDFKMLQLQVLEKKTELANREKYLENLESLSKEIEKYKEEIAKIDIALPRDPNLPQLFKFLEKTCSENGLVFKNVGAFGTVALEKPANTNVTSVEFAVSGKFEDFIKFLSVLEKSARLIEVSSIGFGVPEKAEEVAKNIFSFSLVVKVYSL